MSEQFKPDRAEDSLELVERLMAFEESLIDRILSDPHLDPDQRDRLIREMQERLEGGQFGDDFDDDALAALVRNPVPGNPHGQAGAAVQPGRLIS
jgi:hypothetical protein